MGQRNSEEEHYNSRLDLNQQFDDNNVQVRELKRELIETKNRLSEVEGKFNKIKTISRRALEEFKMVKDSYATEVISRKDAEHLVVRLKSEISFYQQASIFNGNDFIHYSKQEIQDLKATKIELEQICHDLRNERDALVNELETHSSNIEKLLSSQKPSELHWERLQHAYHQQLDSMQKDMQLAKQNYSKLIKGREDIISDMILLNTKNAELSQLNNELSRKVMERENEAKAVFAGMGFLNDNKLDEADTTTTTAIKHKRNLSTGSIGITHSSSMTELKSAAIATTKEESTATSTKLAQRDSFNGSAAPKLFKFRRNRSNSVKKSSSSSSSSTVTEDKIISVPYDTTHNSRSLEPVSESFLKKELESNTTTTSTRGGKHHFAQTKFLRPIKCEACSEKMWRVSELKCSGKERLVFNRNFMALCTNKPSYFIECGIVCHSKCVYSVSQVCNRKSSLDSNKSDADNVRHMFGNDLIKQIQAEKSKIPLVVEKCIESVESRGMDYEGIYRKSGGVGQMRQIQQAFEKGEIPNLIDEEKWNDICAVTSVLKQYFRELPNPLFTYELHSKYMDAMSKSLYL